MSNVAHAGGRPVTPDAPASYMCERPLVGRMPLPLDTSRLFALARDVTDAGGSMWTTGHGGSMSPLLRDGDRLLLRGNRLDLKVGSVVLAKARGRLFVHRVVALSGDMLRTRGDSCDLVDPWISRADVAARVVAAERQGRLRCVEPTLRFGCLAFARYAGSRVMHCARWGLSRVGYRSRPRGRK